jgi:hypothetical protein
MIFIAALASMSECLPMNYPIDPPREDNGPADYSDLPPSAAEFGEVARGWVSPMAIFTTVAPLGSIGCRCWRGNSVFQ